MNALPLITQIAAASSLLALGWLAIRAFRKNPAWGLAVMLLSPVGATFFGLKYWDEEKKAFLAYLTTFVITAALALTLFTAWGGWDLLRTTYQVNDGINSRMLTSRDAENFVKASASFNVPFLPTLPSFTLHHAYVVFDNTGKIHMASNAVPLTLK